MEMFEEPHSSFGSLAYSRSTRS